VKGFPSGLITRQSVVWYSKCELLFFYVRHHGKGARYALGEEQNLFVLALNYTRHPHTHKDQTARIMDNAHIDTLLAGIETLTAEELDKQIKDIGEALAAKKAKIEKRKKEVADYKNGNLVTNKKSPLGGAWAAVLQSRKHKEESLVLYNPSHDPIYCLTSSRRHSTTR